jgi:hypothetical protein
MPNKNVYNKGNGNAPLNSHQKFISGRLRVVFAVDKTFRMHRMAGRRRA